jgi:hypothetical protein
MAVAAGGKTRFDAGAVLRVIFAITAVLLFAWSARDFRNDTLAKIPSKRAVSLQPSKETAGEYSSGLCSSKSEKPWTYLRAMPLDNKVFLPLRRGEHSLLPLYFGAFNNRFEEAMDGTESDKPEIPVPWPA